jgi:uncharacterized protein (TIGR04168 family)
MTKEKNQIKIAIVGDVHDQWEVADEQALCYLGVDLVLFVGDFGNESREVVSQIAAINLPKAVILGNHDCWYTASPWGRAKAPYDQNKEDWVQQQLDLLGETHVGYNKIDFPQFNLSVVGSRPFSWGGSEWKNEDFYRDRYQINNFAESTTRIVEAAQQAVYDTVIMIGHNGPYGLGDLPEDTCGKDWQPLGGDHGDPDFTDAIEKVRMLGKSIPLVTFGHMHHRLRHRKDCLRTIINTSSEGTVYLNSACVPRIKQTKSDCQRSFSLVYLENYQVTQASLIWVDQYCQVTSEKILYQQPKLNLA